MVTKFNPFFIFSHKTSFFLSLSAPEKHHLSKDVYKVFWRTPPIHLNPPSTQRSHPCPDSNLWPRNPASMNINGRPIWRQLKYLHILPRLIGWFWQMKTTNQLGGQPTRKHFLIGRRLVKKLLLQQPSAQGLEGYLRITRDLLKIQRGIRETLTGYGIRQNLGTIYRISLTEIRDAGFSGIRNDRPFQSPSFRPLNNAFNAQQERELEGHLEASVCEKAGVFIKPFNIMGSWPIADNFKYEYHLSSKRKSCLIQLWPAKSEYL